MVSSAHCRGWGWPTDHHQQDVRIAGHQGRSLEMLCQDEGTATSVGGDWVPWDPSHRTVAVAPVGDVDLRQMRDSSVVAGRCLDSHCRLPRLPRSLVGWTPRTHELTARMAGVLDCRRVRIPGTDFRLRHTGQEADRRRSLQLSAAAGLLHRD